MAGAAVVKSSRKAKAAASVWREHHLWCLRISVQRLLARPVGSLLTIIVMGFALALPLTFWLLFANVQHVAGSLNPTQSLNVFMQVDTPQSTVQTVADAVRQRNDVVRVDVRTPEQGLKDFVSAQGFSGALGALGYNPLPYVLVVQPKDPTSAEAVDALVKWLAAQQGVDQVQDDSGWRNRLDNLVAVGQRIVLVLSLLLALAAVLVVGNSVRLDIQTRSGELGILRLVGASNAFVRRPYVYTGVWYGIAGGIVACVLVLLLEWLLAAPLARLSASYGGLIQVQGLQPWQLLLTVVATGILGWIGARVASGYWLRHSA